MSYKKEQFSSKLGFLASAASAAVGLGNIWRFPYLAGRYGGANFLCLYILCVMVLGFPLVLAKLAFGRKQKGGTYLAYDSFQPKIWQLPGLGAAIAATLVLSFYPVITGWLIGYFFKILNGSLLAVNNYQDYFYGFVGSFSQNFLFTFIALALIYVVVIRGVTKGIELMSKVLMPLFLVMLIALIVYVFTLSKSIQGLLFYLVPHFKSMSWEALYAALGQSFGSLAIGAGISITYGAYVQKKDDLVQSTLVIVLSDTVVAILAGLIIFPLIFHKGIAPNGGPALIFISLPVVFQYLGFWTGTIIGGTFFLLLIFAAITSAISIMEVPVKYLMERFQIKRIVAATIIAFIALLAGIPSMLANGASSYFTQFWDYHGTVRSFMDVIDLCSIDLLMPIVAIGFSIVVAHKWPLEELIKEISHHRHRYTFLRRYLKVTIGYLAPILITAIVILKLIQIIPIEMKTFFNREIAMLHSPP